MKRTMVALMLALVMVLTAIGGVVGETATDLAQQIQGTWELADMQGAGDDAGDIAAAMELIKSMGGSISFTFENGTMTMNYSALGQTGSESTSYEIRGNKLVTEGNELNCSISGDQLMLSDSTGMTMILTKSGSSAGGALTTTTTGANNGLVGKWQIVSMNVAEGSDSTLASAMKPYYDEGETFVMTFDGENVSILAEKDSSLDAVAPYTTSGDQLSINNGYLTMTYSFDSLGASDYLILVQGQDEIDLLYIGSLDATTKTTTVDGGSIEGTWKMTGASGNEDGVSEFNLMLQLGATITMEFKNGSITMTASYFGQNETQDLGEYTVSGNTVYISGDPCTFSINGNNMTLDLGNVGVVLTLERN